MLKVYRALFNYARILKKESFYFAVINILTLIPCIIFYMYNDHVNLNYLVYAEIENIG